MLIGLSGAKGSGKTEAASYLVDSFNFSRVGFADLLKAAAGLIYGLTDEQLYGSQDIKESLVQPYDLSVRYILQKFGAEVCREIHPDTWTIGWERTAQRLLEAGCFVVVDDVRFPNEVTAIHQYGGVIWWVSRSSVEVAVRAEDHHVSENFDVLVVDGILDNSGDIFALRSALVVKYQELQS